MVRPLRAGMLLSRTPIITKEPSAFAKTYYRYMDELEKRLMWTFPSYFYFKRGSVAERKFDQLQRGPVPRHKDVYFSRGLPDIKHNRERREKQVVNLPKAGEGVDSVVAQPRESKYDGDIRSLGRKLDETLYLLVKQNKGDGWRIPNFEVSEQDKSLHEAAESGMLKLGGPNMNIWTVSNTPAAVLNKDSAAPEFVIKSHVLHGEFVPAKDVEYAWLTSAEVKEKAPEFYQEVQYLL